MFSVGLIAVLGANVIGCALVKQLPIEPTVIATFTGKQFVVSNRPIPDFRAVTRAGMAIRFVPIIGHPAAMESMTSAGNALVQEYQISDPAPAIAAEIARRMESRYGITYAGVGSVVVIEDDVSTVSASYKQVPLVLDVKTLNWGLLYFRVWSDRYRAFYVARIRVIDTGSSTVIAEGPCRSVPEQTDDSPTYDELVENSAARLKADLKKAIRFCIEEFSSRYLGM